MRTRKAVRPKFPVESCMGKCTVPSALQESMANNAGRLLVLGYCSGLRKETDGADESAVCNLGHLLNEGL
jgi:hypothetical protein